MHTPINTELTPTHKTTPPLQQGIRNLPVEEADRLSGADPDYSIRDLYNAIATGDYPSWTVYIQVRIIYYIEIEGLGMVVWVG